MPPRGLYPIPRHHLYGGHAARAMFNSNDFGKGIGNLSAEENASVGLDGAADDRGGQEDMDGNKKKGKKRKMSEGRLPAQKSSDSRAGGLQGVSMVTKKKRKGGGKRSGGDGTMAVHERAGLAPNTVGASALSAEPKAEKKQTKDLASRRVSVVQQTPVPLPTLESLWDSPTARKSTGKVTGHAKAVKTRTKKKASELSSVHLSRQRSGKSDGQALLSPEGLDQDVNLFEEVRAMPISRGASIATSISVPDSAASFATTEGLNRVGMPYARSGAEDDPFVVPEKIKKAGRENHEEAGISVFNERYRDAQSAINFSDEQTHLSAYFLWIEENYSVEALPCLGMLTGCTPKKEKTLRLSREDNPTVTGLLEASGSQQATLVDADMRAHHAESFLIQAVRARVPVPIGPVDGVWSLYCPRYAMHHFDRYGFGKRSLYIWPSLQGKNLHTASLSIPPRSMPYPILDFATPPHASFRTTTVTIAPEGYRVDVIFLGNGYLQMRVDLNLLLRGKESRLTDGNRAYMEFVGVHEKSTVWVDEKNEVEEEGRKLFAKYGGTDDD